MIALRTKIAWQAQWRTLTAVTLCVLAAFISQGATAQQVNTPTQPTRPFVFLTICPEHYVVLSNLSTAVARAVWVACTYINIHAAGVPADQNSWLCSPQTGCAATSVQEVVCSQLEKCVYVVVTSIIVGATSLYHLPCVGGLRRGRISRGWRLLLHKKGVVYVQYTAVVGVNTHKDFFFHFTTGCTLHINEPTHPTTKIVSLYIYVAYCIQTEWDTRRSLRRPSQNPQSKHCCVWLTRWTQSTKRLSWSVTAWVTQRVLYCCCAATFLFCQSAQQQWTWTRSPRSARPDTPRFLPLCCVCFCLQNVHLVLSAVVELLSLSCWLLTFLSALVGSWKRLTPAVEMVSGGGFFSRHKKVHDILLYIYMTYIIHIYILCLKQGCCSHIMIQYYYYNCCGPFREKKKQCVSYVCMYACCHPHLLWTSVSIPFG